MYYLNQYNTTNKSKINITKIEISSQWISSNTQLSKSKLIRTEKFELYITK